MKEKNSFNMPWLRLYDSLKLHWTDEHISSKPYSFRSCFENGVGERCLTHPSKSPIGFLLGLDVVHVKTLLYE